MLIKQIILKLEKNIQNKFPEYEAKFYSNRRNYCIHKGLDKKILEFSNFQELLKEVTLFLDENIPNKFTDNFPRLIHSTKWRFDYTVATKNNG